jgi:hypothetical protein
MSHNVNGPTPPPTPPSQSLWILHPPRQHFCMLFSDEDWSVSEVQGVSTFYFPPSGKLKTLVLIPTSKTRTRRDLNLNNALRKRKRTTWTELNWTAQFSLSAEPLHTPHSKLFRSYSEAIPKQLLSPPVKTCRESVKKSLWLKEGSSVSQWVSQSGNLLCFSYLLFTL